MDKGLSARTYNHHLSLATGFLRWAVKMGRLAYNPAQVLTALDEDRDRRYKRRSLTEEELSKLFEHAETKGRKAWYLTAFWAGLRLGELGRLTWADVDLENAVLTVRDGKAHRVDRIPMHADLVEELSRRKDPLAHPTSRVFPTSVTSRTRVKDFTDAGIVLEDEEGRHADLHALRATLGTMLARAGVSPQVAREIMRHSDYRTTLKSYTMLALSDSSSAVAKLDIKTPAHSPAVGARSGAKACETVRDGEGQNETREVG